MIKVTYKRFGINRVEYIEQVHGVSVANESWVRPNIGMAKKVKI